MPIWGYVDESVYQDVVLVSWSVMETAAGDRHFVGLTEHHREGRVSSAIAFDPEKGVASTRSGRRYRLRGRPGAASMLTMFGTTGRLRIAAVSARDVTLAIYQRMQLVERHCFFGEWQ